MAITSTLQDIPPSLSILSLTSGLHRSTEELLETRAHSVYSVDNYRTVRSHDDLCSIERRGGCMTSRQALEEFATI